VGARRAYPFGQEAHAAAGEVVYRELDLALTRDLETQPRTGAGGIRERGAQRRARIAARPFPGTAVKTASRRMVSLALNTVVPLRISTSTVRTPLMALKVQLVSVT